ncbi:MAG: hypothetical protein ACKVXR_15810 [Planctomycetota bacterium]
MRNPFEEPIQIVLELWMPHGSRLRIDCFAKLPSFVREPFGLPVGVLAPDGEAPLPPSESARRHFLGKLFQVEGGSEWHVRWTCLKPGLGGSPEARAWRQDEGSRTLLGGVVFGPAVAP